MSRRIIIIFDYKGLDIATYVETNNLAENHFYCPKFEERTFNQAAEEDNNWRLYNRQTKNAFFLNTFFFFLKRIFDPPIKFLDPPDPTPPTCQPTSTLTQTVKYAENMTGRHLVRQDFNKKVLAEACLIQ